MITTQSSFPRRTAPLFASIAAMLSGCTCTPKDALVAPAATVAPYGTGATEVLWAVAPPRNESGTTAVDPLAVGDAIAAAAEEIRGVRCVPLNRTIDAMRSLKMAELTSPADARKLATAMQVDGLLVSSITAYDPYTPQIGLAVALYARPGAMIGQSPQTSNPRQYATMTTDSGPTPTAPSAERPVALTSDHFDARNHQVLADLQTYAAGRMKQQSALQWRSYAASASRFTEFACYRTLQDLVSQEWIRVGGHQTDKSSKPDNSVHRTVSVKEVLVPQGDTSGPEIPRNVRSRADIGY